MKIKKLTLPLLSNPNPKSKYLQQNKNQRAMAYDIKRVWLKPETSIDLTLLEHLGNNKANFALSTTKRQSGCKALDLKKY